jgi:predicted glycosyltransferase
MVNSNRGSLVFYCQSLVGIGHLTASLQVIRELLQHSDVDLIYGGHKIDINLDHLGFRYISLPTILIDEKSGHLYDPDGQNLIEQLWLLRSEKITTFLHSNYDAAIVEFFPFGRRKFKKEIHRLFQQLREQNSNIPIFSFVREVLIPEPVEAEQRIVDSINNFFHTVFIRGDPNVIRFEETFSLTEQIADKIFYLGYLGATLPKTLPPRTNQILVSQGGGNVGKQLLVAAIRTACLLPDHIFMVATGSEASASDVSYLQSFIQSPNVKIVSFLADFRQHMLTSALSINMGGDNTLLDAIVTKTPSLAFPYPGNTEQTIRIEKLANKGLVIHLKESNLNPQSLKNQILSALSKPYPTTSIDLNGATNMSQKIKEIISGIGS